MGPPALPPLATRAGGGAALAELVRIALESLLANRVRALLTMLGVIIGVLSVVTLLAAGAGASEAVTGQVRSLGTNLLTVMAGPPTNRGPGATGTAATLTMGDYAAIVALGLPLASVAPQYQAIGQVVAPAADKEAPIVGTTAPYQPLNSLVVAKGAFFTDDDVRAATPVVVLGANLAASLFGQGEAVGQTVRVRGQPLRVVGVLEAKGGGPFGSVDDRALVAITVAQQRLFGGRTPDGNDFLVSSIGLSAARSEDLPAIQSRVATLLRERHHRKPDGSGDDFTILDQSAFLSALTTISTLLTTFLACIAGISLLVGGIGIMNIMLVSVTERTREIGLRKAVGASGQDILLQFVVEAVVVSVAGGVIGLLLGVGLATAVSLSGLLQMPVSASAVALALGFSIAVGLFFGIYPARRAARLNPIDALRYE
jgi:putative ABC transport system permease protein